MKSYRQISRTLKFLGLQLILFSLFKTVHPIIVYKKLMANLISKQSFEHLKSNNFRFTMIASIINFSKTSQIKRTFN